MPAMRCVIAGIAPPVAMTQREHATPDSSGAVGNGSITLAAMRLSPPAPVRSTVQPSGSRRGRRLDLDVVRGLAIVLALGAHFSKEPSGNVVLDLLTWPGDTFGWAGVDLFFVLSGFLVGTLVFTEHVR